MISSVSILAAALWLGYANGANDNMKGVATLLGSRTASYRTALRFGTAATCAGSIGAIFLAGHIARAFGGRGVVPDALVGNGTLLLAVGAGAAAVVMLATIRGLPISTTHALVGALAGAGIAAAGPGSVSWSVLASAFALPLIASPLLAAALVFAIYPALRAGRRWLRIDHETCWCSGEEALPVAGQAAVLAWTPPRVAPVAECAARYQGRVVGVGAQRMIDVAHFASAGAVSFARGLNDTPKIAALLLIGGGASGSALPTILIAAVMAAGALLHGRRVGETVGFRVTAMNSGQGLVANMATAALVLGASRIGVPVSTTHVSVGALLGLGASTRGLVRATMRRILLAWLWTLPAAMVSAWCVYRIAV